MADEVTGVPGSQGSPRSTASEKRLSSPGARACCPAGDRPVTRRTRLAAGVAGTCGSAACVAAMVLPLLGLAGAGAAAGAQASGGSMAGMGPAPTSTSTVTTTASSHPGGVLGLLVTIGPELLVVSVLLVSVSLALRQRAAAAPALLAGALLYWGMYGQPSVGLMYATIAVAYLAWAATYAWTRTRPSNAGLAGASVRRSIRAAVQASLGR